MREYGRDAVIYCIRQARQKKRSKWSDFDECFILDGSWNHVVGPVRLFLESGGSLDDKDGLFSILEGASLEQKENLYQMAQRRNLKTKKDFISTSRKFSRNLTNISFSIFSVEFGNEVGIEFDFVIGSPVGFTDQESRFKKSRNL